jgi:hypothetical protein
VTLGIVSTGGDLATMMLAPSWQAHCSVPDNLVAGVTLLSRIYDLEPARLGHPIEWLKLGAAEAAALSPFLHLPRSDSARTTVKTLPDWDGDESRCITTIDTKRRFRLGVVRTTKSLASLWYTPNAKRRNGECVTLLFGACRLPNLVSAAGAGCPIFPSTPSFWRIGLVARSARGNLAF